eukprot:CAMPEP_0172512660 /NCGR_PEP_ID=MMETSP1066-20121228/246315_1 /TAXON_ID=671091 /ORGANISM="Coscinodiscus wailesii, Strain CCMP2513" /LENGTH=318 /DNA_ID=CAMNT_0013292573 /DNA_START=312 /DNA_END=1265 /DNA_ORIENTATION=+
MEKICKDHSIFLLDMWGVMHDGTNPYDGVIDTISQLKALGKKMIILSNSSKRRDTAVKMLIKLGFDPDDFDEIITSGEISHQMLSGDPTLACRTWPTLTTIRDRGPFHKKVFCLGSGSHDEQYVTSAGWTLSPISEASLILARGTFTVNDGTTIVKKTEDEEKYFRVLDESLRVAAARRVPMLVSNPDKVRPDVGLPPMPGALGDLYQSLLSGEGSEELVKRIGKPFGEVYELALNGSDPADAVMVGDALETDVTGGGAAGCRTVWVVKDGIHGDAVEEMGGGYEQGVERVLEDFNEGKGFLNGDGVRPSFVVPHFRW